ncbi:hypothetical protein HUE87_02655 [Candidatus Sulfurimonas marisnigri]|uniref:HTH cro/C1-type domain-containing protein n=1 Tax=Candidatus Sulfurimonas marisnigri TaxID=2740405 RepID=A0A7S7M266_9BACT|nr:hypothetical protein [Candidatus Sulfurimonas marisnigri]QOY55158.1 hypothetical protein HUE87_02655 [Candidatus Sulfurimonas marisnigri]
MIELKTPSETIDILVENIERARKTKRLKQSDLCTMADISVTAYQNFIYKKNTNLIALIKIMHVLKMWNNLEGLIEFKEQLSIQDIRDINKKKELPKRIRNEK